MSKSVPDLEQALARTSRGRARRPVEPVAGCGDAALRLLWARSPAGTTSLLRWNRAHPVRPVRRSLCDPSTSGADASSTGAQASSYWPQPGREVFTCPTRLRPIPSAPKQPPSGTAAPGCPLWAQAVPHTHLPRRRTCHRASPWRPTASTRSRGPSVSRSVWPYRSSPPQLRRDPTRFYRPSSAVGLRAPRPAPSAHRRTTCLAGIDPGCDLGGRGGRARAAGAPVWTAYPLGTDAAGAKSLSFEAGQFSCPFHRGGNFVHITWSTPLHSAHASSLRMHGES